MAMHRGQTMSDALIFENVWFSYNKQPILRDVSFRIEEGSSLGLIGSSGSGKTTLGRLATGLARPERGIVTCKAGKVPHPSISMVFQDSFHAFHPLWTSRQALREQANLSGIIDRQAQDKAINQVLELAEFAGSLLDQNARSLSGGQRQRLALARALLSGPSMLVLDEPTANLDPSVESKILETLLRLQKERNIAMLCISHNPELVQYLCSRVHILQDGQLSGMFPSDSPSPGHITIS